MSRKLKRGLTALALGLALLLAPFAGGSFASAEETQLTSSPTPAVVAKADAKKVAVAASASIKMDAKGAIKVNNTSPYTLQDCKVYEDLNDRARLLGAVGSIEPGKTASVSFGGAPENGAVVYVQCGVPPVTLDSFTYKAENPVAQYDSHRVVWYGKWSPTDVAATAAGVGTSSAYGLAHRYPQYLSLEALGLKCGDKYVTQTDQWVGLKADIATAKTWNTLRGGQDSHLFRVVAGQPKPGWRVDFHTLPACTTQPDAKVTHGEWVDGAKDCKTGKVEQTRTVTTTPYVWDGKAWVLDTANAKSNTETQTRTMTADELKACVSPVTPPVVTPPVTPTPTAPPVKTVVEKPKPAKNVAGRGVSAKTGVEGLDPTVSWLFGLALCAALLSGGALVVRRKV